ncbi:putative reverse transcriptase domain-containing protein [Tanacetum coccineum]
MRDMRRKMDDMQAELLALRGQQRARQPGPDARIPDHQDASRDADTLLRISTNEDGSHSSHEDNRRNVQTARPCFYTDFMKYQPLNFKGTEGVVGLTRWIEKIEFIRTLGPDAYSMTWEVLKKKMTDKYCPHGEIRKLEIELWNLKFVANETEKVDKYISGLLDNIYGNVKSARPKMLDETIELANDLMDQKLRTYAERYQVKDNKIDLLVQQYEQFTILVVESIDSVFARFNTIITSFKALDEAIEESKDLSSLKFRRATQSKKASDDETFDIPKSDDEEYVMTVRNFKKFFRRNGKFVRQPREEKKSFRQRDKKKAKSDRKCFRCGNPNHLIGDCPKPPRNKDQKAFIGGSWSDSENDVEDKTNDEACLIFNRQIS